MNFFFSSFALNDTTTLKDQYELSKDVAEAQQGSQLPFVVSGISVYE